MTGVDSFIGFMREGGIIVWIILAFSCVMWALLINGWVVVRQAERTLPEQIKKVSTASMTDEMLHKWIRLYRSEVGRIDRTEIAWSRVIVSILP
ncbi:MAG: hypothetical protein Q4E62_07495, partial [Sutterellaceae bacterium]|nr:hypothetical protein [Sutterellaceae bacterium]